jgi:hypothetical protein
VATFKEKRRRRDGDRQRCHMGFSLCPHSMRRGSSVATHWSHGLARWASHSLSVGKVLTITHPDKGQAAATWMA